MERVCLEEERDVDRSIFVESDDIDTASLLPYSYRVFHSVSSFACRPRCAGMTLKCRTT